jgi:uncharacterized membrane-anchored protein YhcB (DUF1043 family)
MTWLLLLVGLVFLVCAVVAVKRLNEGTANSQAGANAETDRLVAEANEYAASARQQYARRLS